MFLTYVLDTSAKNAENQTSKQQINLSDLICNTTPSLDTSAASSQVWTNGPGLFG